MHYYAVPNDYSGSLYTKDVNDQSEYLCISLRRISLSEMTLAYFVSSEMRLFSEEMDAIEYIKKHSHPADARGRFSSRPLQQVDYENHYYTGRLGTVVKRYQTKLLATKMIYVGDRAVLDLPYLKSHADLFSDDVSVSFVDGESHSLESLSVGLFFALCAYLIDLYSFNVHKVSLSAFSFFAGRSMVESHYENQPPENNNQMIDREIKYLKQRSLSPQ
ncbi:MAG: hypothetical protein SFW66_08585 [Gammaproteobacteria bacterium]|nr:hypothetical protein [Gammaproteobacteria bacterium]